MSIGKNRDINSRFNTASTIVVSQRFTVGKRVSNINLYKKKIIRISHNYFIRKQYCEDTFYGEASDSKHKYYSKQTFLNRDVWYAFTEH